MANSAIILSFRYSKIDYVRAMRVHYAEHLHLWLDTCAIVLCAGLALYLWAMTSSHWLGLALFGLSGALALMLLAAFFVIPALTFRREPKFRDEYALTFSQEGIHFKTAHVDSQLQWSLYSSALVGPHSYVLYYGTRSFTVIPKRVFQNTEQQQAFDELLVKHVPRIVRKRPATSGDRH